MGPRRFEVECGDEAYNYCWNSHEERNNVKWWGQTISGSVSFNAGQMEMRSVSINKGRK